MRGFQTVSGTVLSVAAVQLLASVAPAYAADDLFQNMTLTQVVPVSPGGGYSRYALFLQPHLQRHLPGKPKIVVTYMPGAAGIKAANYVANVAPKDGTVFTMPTSTFVIETHLRPKHARYNPQAMHFIGRLTPNPRVLVVSTATGVKTIGDAKQKVMSLSASTKTSITYFHPTLANEYLGTKFKMVLGYRGNKPSLLAVERGEADGTTLAWLTTVVAQGGERFLAQKKLTTILNLSMKPLMGAPNVPSLRDLLTKPSEKALFDYVTLPSEVGVALVLPAGVPANVVAALRKAFDDTMQDRQLIADAKKRNIILEPMPGAEVDKLVARHAQTSKEVIDRFKKEFMANAKRGKRKKRATK